MNIIMNARFLLLLLLVVLTSGLSAQTEAPANWFNLDQSKDGVPGLGTESLYQRISKGKKGETVVVAVIDSGVDYLHEDLKDIMWVNPGEIAGNGIDDDHNGYIDDIHGWNFLGNAKGENVVHDNLEVTRLYAQYKKKFANVDPVKLGKKNKALYEQYLEYKGIVETKRESASKNFTIFSTLKELISKMKASIKKDEITLNDIKKFKTDDDKMKRLVGVIKQQMEQGMSFEEFDKQVEEAYEHYDGEYNFNYNPDYDSRSLVGDNYADLTQRFYGNNDVKGPDARHGTHVAGIIGAIRGNNIGMDGVADNVRIMSVRTVPDGDERDKDVANAIRYAVDNGAKVINMSFGKGQSPNKKYVDEAVKYAMKKDVLLVHAAGNDGKENDFANNYPNDLLGKKYAENWIEIGASNWVTGDHLAASFSNYSPKLVDVFAPGEEIYSTTPDNTYENLQGTSMASPMVAGVAAVVRSYFPDLTAVQVKDIIAGSAVKEPIKVVKPGTEDEMVDFSTLSTSGGVANVEAAVDLAIKTVGKKKGAKRYLTAADLEPKKVIVP
jgi:subtilisin family serine protease